MNVVNFLTSYFRSNKEENDEREYGHWDQLPFDIMEKILKQLSHVADSVRMSCVCKSWRSIITKENNNTTRNRNAQVPWLMLPHVTDNNNNLLKFYDLCEGRLYNLKLPKNMQGSWYGSGSWCCGSSKGWLVMLKGSKFNPDIYLFDPISGIQLPLPPLTTIPSFENFLLDDRPYYYGTAGLLEFIRKVELSSVDARNCMVAATFNLDGSLHKTLALCKPGNKRWVILDKEYDEFGTDIEYGTDILFYNGELHVLISRDASFATSTIKVGDDDLFLKLIPNNPMSMIEDLEDDWNPEEDESAEELMIASYLVESDGELLIVYKIENFMKTVLLIGEEEEEEEEEEEDEFTYNPVIGFEVAKINHDPSGTMRLTRVNSLGERVLFVTRSSSLSVPATNGLGNNCIFFVDDSDIMEHSYHPHASRESGIFYLDDGRIERPFPGTKDSIYYHMLWFSPNL
ncbi:hypothetical protein AB3S75_043830 [Citrus x aurantiifolia]